jgi:tetratricopeptide (TPR) repeat protein
VGGWTVEAAAEVADLEEERALELLEALARHSLIYLDSTESGPRSRMLETIRAFVAERLAARADAAEVERRHAEYYRDMAEEADRPLRGAGQLVGCGHLDTEQGNLAAAVRWYLVHDTQRLPHMFRVLWLFWFLRDHLGEARSWVGELMPAIGSLDPQAQAELSWTAAATGVEVGDDQLVLAAAERLERLAGQIEDLYLRAVSQLTMAWASGIDGGLDDAVRRARDCLEQLHGQDEPFWSALAGYTAGLVETATGRYDDALGHLTETRDLADLLDNPWLAAVSRVELGALAVAQDRPQEAREPMNEGLELSLAAHSTRSVTLCLAAFARLEFVEGDLERAALLAGATDGLRRRVGLRAWPLLRRGEAELTGQVRAALGRSRFDEQFAAGSRLSRQEAVNAVREWRSVGSGAP